MNTTDNIIPFLELCQTTIGATEWKRRLNVAQKFEEALIDRINHAPEEYIRWINRDDLTGWYLYQMYLYVNDTQACDLNFAARTAPKFAMISNQLDQLNVSKGFKEKLTQMLKPKFKDIESTVMEFLVAVMYMRCGKYIVSFDLDQSQPSADLKIERGNETLRAECKRFEKDSLYAKSERKRWLYLFDPLRRELKQSGVSQVFDVVFHKPLEAIPENYLFERARLAIGVSTEGVISDDETATITVRPTNIQGMKSNLKRNMTRSDTTFLFKFLFGYDDYRKGLTSMIYGKPHWKYPRYLCDIEFASAGIWMCDSLNSIQGKSRSLKRQLSKALKQLTAKGSKAVHIVLESNEGFAVEQSILDDFLDELKTFGFEIDRVPTIYIHIIRFFVPPEKNWEVTDDCIMLIPEGADPSFLIDDAHIIQIASR